MAMVAFSEKHLISGPVRIFRYLVLAVDHIIPPGPQHTSDQNSLQFAQVEQPS